MQLGLFTAPASRPPPRHSKVSARITTACQLLYEAAARPDYPELETVPFTGRCWWCAHPLGPRGRDLRSLASTFPDAHLAQALESGWLCAACGWTLCDKIALPRDYALARVRMRAESERRILCSAPHLPAGRYLIAMLPDGRAGVWTAGPRPAAEKGWQRATKTEGLTMGPCKWIGAWRLEDIRPSPVEKFRAYHHLAALGDAPRWVACTSSDKPAVREWLTDPPEGDWCAVIGDGKKHAAIYAQPTLTGAPQCTAFFQGDNVAYEPDALESTIQAWESVIAAGAGDDEIHAGRYSRMTRELRVALRDAEPLIRRVRGTAAAHLVQYLRRPRRDL